MERSREIACTCEYLEGIDACRPECGRLAPCMLVTADLFDHLKKLALALHVEAQSQFT